MKIINTKAKHLTNSLVKWEKDNTSKRSTNNVDIIGVVYNINCKCGKVYIGATERTLGERIKEHCRDVTNTNINNAIYVHLRDHIQDNH